MATYLEGDIFENALDKQYDLAVVFGHIGLNEMAHTWRKAKRRVQEWYAIDDPFQMIDNIPQRISSGEWFWFVPCEENHGIRDDRLSKILEDIFSWASDNQLRTIVTNGVSNTDKGINIDSNRASDDERVHFINEIVIEYEREGFQVTLISMNDAYTRNFT